MTAAPSTRPPTRLVDAFDRLHTNLRISVTDRCNIRCFYCMPAENVRFKPRDEILTFEEIERFVRVLLPLGVDKLRITGGEPLVRAEIPELIGRLARLDGVRDLAMTTNGLLLANEAVALRAAGLQRLNISLDAVSETNFQRIARRPGVHQVLEGIAAAQAAGFTKIRLNAVAIRGITESEAVPLARFARDHQLELRFIEFMPLDGDESWDASHVLDGASLRDLIGREIAPLVPVTTDPSQPARDYQYADGVGTIGFIDPVTQPFCQSCNRLRITADGHVRNCLFSTQEWDARALMRQGGTDEALQALVIDCVQQKRAAHGIDRDDFIRPDRAMYQIGG